MSDIDDWLRQLVAEEEIPVQEVPIKEDLPTYKGGYIYLVKAKGFHGLFPGDLVTRGKIGLTNNFSRRIKELNGSQAPCPIIPIKVVMVENMQTAETYLHNKFAQYRLDFEAESSSSEWFDIPRGQVNRVKSEMDKLAMQNQQNRTEVGVLGWAIALALAVVILISLIG